MILGNDADDAPTDKPLRRVTVVRDGERYDLTATNLDVVRDGSVTIGIVDLDEIPDWMAVFSHGPKAVIYDDQYDAITFSSLEDSSDDDLVRHSDDDDTLPSIREVREQSE